MIDARRLFDEHHGALYRYLVRLTGDSDVAHDAVQETFTRLLTRPPRDEQPRAWLFTVATNIVRTWSGTQRRHATLLADNPHHVPVPASHPAPDDSAIAVQRKTAVDQALQQLSEKERTVLLMREEGFTHREIAEAVGTTTGSVGTMIARALDRLATLLPIDAEAL